MAHAIRPSPHVHPTTRPLRTPGKKNPEGRRHSGLREPTRGQRLGSRTADRSERLADVCGDTTQKFSACQVLCAGSLVALEREMGFEPTTSTLARWQS